MKRLSKTLAALLLTLGLAIPAAALAGPGGRHHRGGGPDPAKMVEMLERHADELGIDDATLQKLDATVEQNRDAIKALRTDAKTARKAVREAMKADNPDKTQVLRLIEQAGQAKIALEQQRAVVMLDLRAQLSPAQRDAIKAHREARKDRWKARGDKRGKWGKRGKHEAPDEE